VDYYRINRISNSELGRFLSEHILKKPRTLPQTAVDFGQVLHHVLLEPHTPPPAVGKINTRLLDRLHDRVYSSPFCRYLIANSQRELSVLWTDQDTGAGCKAKLDMLYHRSDSQKMIVDFKTTDARDYAQFLRSLLELNYDRQTAFYMDSLQLPHAPEFLFIGIQKRKPYDLFYFHADQAEGFVQTGRKKYKALLRSYVNHYNLAPVDCRCGKQVPTQHLAA
jgi:hypothetical protein